MKIIGISGIARSGKDTLAKMLITEAGEAIHMSFAEPIRSFVAGLLGVPVADLLDGGFKEAPLADLNGKSPRYLMQTLGTEWGREMVDPDLWVKVAKWRLDRLSNSLTPPKLVVFSDVRFSNEAEMIRRAGGSIVHLRRQSAGLSSIHASELGIPPHPIDRIITNDGALSELLDKAREFLRELEG
jgi:hypothetical protein